MAMKYVYSTLTSNVAYTIWEKSRANDMHKVVRKVIINGGANVANRKTLMTPKGAVTKISEEDLALVMEQCPSFKRQMKRGYLKVEDKDYSVEKVSETMTSRDDSAPITPEDMESDGKTPGTTAEIKSDDEDSGDPKPPARRGRPPKAK